jgi:hypothetical protein
MPVFDKIQAANGYSVVHGRTPAAGGMRARVSRLAVVVPAWLPSSVSPRPLWRISRAALQTSQSFREAGKLEWSFRAGFRPEMRFAVIGSNWGLETGIEFGGPSLPPPVLPALAGKMGKNPAANEPGMICVFIGSGFEIVMGLAYTWPSLVEMV